MSTQLQITNAKYTDGGFITATVDGVDMTIPVDPANRHYAEILEQEITPDPAYTAAEMVSNAKKARRKAVNEKRKYLENTGAPFDGDLYRCDDMSAGAAAAKLQRLRDASATSGEWIAIDNTIVQMTFAEFELFAAAMGVYQDAIVLSARTHKNNINALANVASIEAYDITINWGV